MPEDDPLDYAPPAPRRRSLTVDLVMIAGIVGLVVACVLPLRWHYVRPIDPTLRCASYLRQIGQAIMLYQADFAGRNPPDLQTTIPAEGLAPEVLICRLTNDAKATGATPADIAADIAKGGHCSYLYVGSSLNSKSDPNCIVAIEDPGNHRLALVPVLYADGRVDRVSIETAITYLNDLDKGLNPPTTPVTMSAAQARQDYLKNWKQRMPALKSGVWRIPTTQPAK